MQQVESMLCLLAQLRYQDSSQPSTPGDVKRLVGEQRGTGGALQEQYKMTPRKPL